jgi:hypothetical protein
MVELGGFVAKKNLQHYTFYGEVLLGGLQVTTLGVQRLVHFSRKMGRWLTMTMHCNLGIVVVIV